MEKQYYFEDGISNSSSYLYRLKQIDYSGKIKFYKAITVNISIIETYVLQQNYPNPFNPSTTIIYQIPELSFVTLKVYDVLGNEITSLVNEEKSAGSYEVEFNASELSSGIYFYQLKLGKSIQTRKMILTK